jgi:hypothetical protein
MRESLSSTVFEAPPPGASKTTVIDDDGIDDVVVTFSVAALRAAGLLGEGSSQLSVDIRVPRQDVADGYRPSAEGGHVAGSLAAAQGAIRRGPPSHYLLDPARDRLHLAGRPPYLRLWYPAASTSAQPANYFLVPETARVIATSLGLPEELFDLVHASSARDAAPAALGPCATLLLSTGLGNPLDTYSVLAEDLASHGYLVVGVGHPDGGSGQIAYPDGSVGEDEISAALDDLQRVEDPALFFPLVDELLSGVNFEWARDLS